LVLVAVPATASEIGLGPAFMDTSEADNDAGFTATFSLDVGDHWNVDMRASFFDGHSFVHPQRIVEIDATPVDLGLSYDFSASGKMTVYVGGGISYTLYSSTSYNTILDQAEQSRVKDEPGWYGLIGVKGPLKDRIGFFVEGLYRQVKANVQGDGLAAFDNIGVDFAGGGAAAGLSFNW
jgi:hypothetical protein